LAGGGQLHIRQTTRFKSVWVDLFLPQLLQPVAVTQLALLSRLLERGTRRLPDLRALNQYTDWLYGAAFSVQSVAFGPFQLLHLHYDAVDGAFVPRDGDDLLERGLGLLGEVLAEPFLEDGQLPQARIEQEKASLRRFVESLLNDRSLLAQRRCMECIGADTPWALAPHGSPAELSHLDGASLLSFLRNFVIDAPMDIYVCGDVDTEQVADLCVSLLPAAHDDRRACAEIPQLLPLAGPQQILESADVSQGRLVLGFRTPIRLGATVAEYAALMLMNLLFGGDAYSRLYNHIREQLGLCYHIASYLEPMAGLLLVEAGVEPEHRSAVVEQVLQELRELGTHGPSRAEVERAQALARQRLDGAEDDRESLVHFHHARRLAGTNGSRLQLHAALAAVPAEAVQSIAATTVLDTEYFLGPQESA
tara:strand:- start:1941 stop:3203 length:1263 start_codon:yes stop_codon:yes gene_type:complete